MPEETDKYIRILVRNCSVTATITISSSKGIKALYCGAIKKVRTYLFLKSKGWTMKTAKQWVKEHSKAMDEFLDTKGSDIVWKLGDEGKKYLVGGKDYGWKSYDVINHDPSQVIQRSIYIAKGSGVIKALPLTDKRFEMIKKFVPDSSKISKDDYHTFRVQLANNIPDRSEERFRERVTKTLSDTLVGKGFLIAHKWEEPGFGFMFNTGIRKTGYVFDYKGVKFSMQWIDVDVAMGADGETLDGRKNEYIIQNLDRGFARFASIGFRAPRKIAVYDKDENFLFYEIDDDPENGRYAEGLEGSLVWLGAQYGAMPVGEKMVNELRKGISVDMTDTQRQQIFHQGNVKIYFNLLRKEVEEEVKEKVDEQNPMVQETDNADDVILDANEDFTKNVEETPETEEEKNDSSQEININLTTPSEVKELSNKLDDLINRAEKEKKDEKKSVSPEDEFVKIKKSEWDDLKCKLERAYGFIEEFLPDRKSLYEESEKTFRDSEPTDAEKAEEEKILGIGNPMVRDE